MNGLHQLIQNRSGLRLVRAFLDSTPAAIHAPDEYGCYPLYTVVCEKQVRIVDYLLSKNPDIDHICQGFGETALHIACELNVTPIVRQLLNSGANSELLDKSGQTPLYRVARTAHSPSRTAVISVLLEHGADLDLNSAICIGPDRVRELFVKRPDCIGISLFPESLLYDCLRVGPNPIETLQILLDRGIDPNCFDSRNAHPPLTFAVEYPTTEATQLLLRAGADPLAKNPDGQSVYEYAKYRAGRGAYGAKDHLDLLRTHANL